MKQEQYQEHEDKICYQCEFRADRNVCDGIENRIDCIHWQVRMRTIDSKVVEIE
jgi:hypothetical protein